MSRKPKLADVLKNIASPFHKKWMARAIPRVEQLGDRITPANFTADSTLADGAIGSATLAGGTASLRQVITLANTNTDATNTISFTANTYTLTLPQASQENANASGDLDIVNVGTPGAPKTYIFQGAGTGTVIQQTIVDRVFQILGPNVVVKFQNLAITGGQAVDDGTDAVLPGATDAKGGGLLNTAGGDVFFTNALVQGNVVGGAMLNGDPGLPGVALGDPGKNGGDGKNAFGGGVYSKGGIITVAGTSDFKGNKAIAGIGGLGGDGKTGSIAKQGGKGGDGGKGGAAFGGGIYAEAGSVSVTGTAIIELNEAHAGAAGAGGKGGKAGAGQFAGAGGRGGDASNAGGGGVYTLSGPVSFAAGTQIVNNAVNSSAGDGQGGRGGGGGLTTAGGGGGGAGGNGGNGGNAVGGGLAVVSGDVTIGTGAKVFGNSINKGGTAGGSMGPGGGGTGGIGADGGVGKSGGAGGSGGNGGTAFGGGIYAANGKVAITGGLIQNNTVNIGSSGFAAAAGGRGKNGGQGKNGGVNGAGGAGGDAGGAGIYASLGSVTLSGAQVTGNQGSGGFGGTGGDGRAAGATSPDGFGRAGGDGGNAGSFLGGGIYAGSGDVTIDLASSVTANKAIGAEGGDGNYGDDGGVNKGVGGVGGKGGNSGMALGGGVYAKAGNVLIQGKSSVNGNQANVAAPGGGDGGSGGRGGSVGPTAVGGAGGAAGIAAKAGGGGVYVVAGNVSVLGGSSITNNSILSGKGQAGGCGGSGVPTFRGGNGADASPAGPAVGGGIADELGNVTVDGVSTISLNIAVGGEGNDGGSGRDAGVPGGFAGNAGNGSTGGAAQGGGIWALKGNVVIQGLSQVRQNEARAGKGGNGGLGGTGSGAGASKVANGAGGNGGNSGDAAGGGLWVQDGSVKVSGSAAFASNAANHLTQMGGIGDGGQGRRRGQGPVTAALQAIGNNGSGGNGGLAQGGAIWIGAATVTIDGRADFSANQAVGGGGGTVSAASAAVAGGKAGNGGSGGAAEGGAIYTNSGAVSVSLSRFTGNLATGGIGQDGGGFGTVIGGAGTGGSGGAGRGGAIATNTGTLSLSEVNFGGVGSTVAGSNTVRINTPGTGNIATGGAAGNGGVGKTAPGGNGGNSAGGAVYAPATAGAVTVLSSSFYNNLAAAGGASGAGAPAGTQGKSLGGAFYSEAATTSITNSTFSENAVGASAIDSAGGAIALDSPIAKIHNSTIVFNTGVANTAGGGIKVKSGALELVSTIVGQNGLAANIGAAITVNGKDLDSTGTLSGDHNMIENNTGFSGISDGVNGNVVGKSFTNPAFNDPVTNTANALSSTGGPGNTVFVIGSQTAPNGTAEHGLVTPDVFSKLPVGALSALNNGANPDNLLVDQIQGARVQGLAADVGAIEGNGLVTDTSGAFVVSVVFSTKIAPGTATFDTATVTFNEAIDPTSFSTAQVLSLTGPTGNSITPTAVTLVAGSGNKVFEISFPNQAVLGVYTLLLSQTMRDTAVGGANQMDDNKNGINGEATPNPSGDQHVATAVLRDPAITSGAKVVSAVFSGPVGAFNKVELTFDQPIDANTFTITDVMVSGPPGAPAIFVTGVTRKAGTMNVFDVTFTPKSPGPDTVTLGVDILDFGGVAGNQMNQNGNTVNGEPGTAPAGDQFQSTSDTEGANITKATFSGAIANTFDTVELVFSEAINPTSFTTADITLTGPVGAIAPTAVTLKAGTTDTFDVTFPSQSKSGTYTLTTSVDILDISGNQMDQNLNKINGEPGIAPAGDQFQAKGSIANTTPGILAVGGSNGRVRILNAATGAVIANVRPLDVVGGSQYTGLIEVALGDFNFDGVADLVVAAANPAGVAGLATSMAGKAFVYDGAALTKGTLTLNHTFTPFATTDGPAGKTGAYINGLNIATGDVNGDGRVDFIAGSRGGTGTAGLAEFGRLAVIEEGTDADGSDDSNIGSIQTPFGAGYQKGVVVAAGDLDGTLNTGGFAQDEIAVTRGGPVAASNPNKTVKLKAYQFNGSDLSELNLSGTGSPFAPFAGIGSGDTVLQRDARVAFVDTNADGKSDLVFSVLDRTTDPNNFQVRIAAFSVNTSTGLATAVSTGTGPSKSYLVGTDIVDHAISNADPIGSGAEELALLTESASSGVQYLDPLTGSVLTGGFPLTIMTGGIALDGI
ncbi:MAG: hypothetical protein K8U57_19125 [Planctomycetes bacterium]|nr:hypothetical protein [Planctomycetota bacterium]